jgi:hypothetical protein
VNTKTLLLLGGAAVAAVILLKRKPRVNTSGWGSPEYEASLYQASLPPTGAHTAENLAQAFRSGAMSEVVIDSPDPAILAAQRLGFETYRAFGWDSKRFLALTDADIIGILRKNNVVA